jgi:carotenoid 1,2-hydratase
MSNASTRDPRASGLGAGELDRGGDDSEPTALGDAVFREPGIDLRPSTIFTMGRTAKTHQRTSEDSGPLSRGRSRSPGRRRPDGDALGGHRDSTGTRDAFGLEALDAVPPRGGYAWWYVDIVSDDGRWSLVFIAFTGFVFSPSYKKARASKGGGDPLEHVAINVALYDRHTRTRWALNEGGKESRRASRDELSIGNSSISYQRNKSGALIGIELSIDEPTTRFFGIPGERLRGQVTLRPTASPSPVLELASEPALHRWQVVAPVARAKVSLSAPNLSFSGHGYADANRGDGPIEDAFSSWRWSRRSLGGCTEVAYDVTPRIGERRAFWLSADGHATQAAEAGKVRSLAARTSPWGVAMPTIEIAGDGARAIRIVRKPEALLDDSPFYSRWSLAGGGIGESLDLDRFAHPFVQHLLGYRIHRAR